MTNKSTFTKEFKLEAIRLLELGETPGTVLARELGNRRNLLYKWQTELNNKGDKAFRGQVEMQ
jgi:transposase